MNLDNNIDHLKEIEKAIDNIKSGGMVIVIDDRDRENEGDFVLAAEKVTPEIINFITRHGRGMVCAPATSARLAELELDLMVEKNTSLHGTPFTVTVDYSPDTTTGISAFDRAATLRALADPSAKPSDFAKPGHIFPLMARDGGVLRRAVTPRPQSIYAASPDYIPSACSARLCLRTALWPVTTSWKNWPKNIIYL